MFNEIEDRQKLWQKIMIEKGHKPIIDEYFEDLNFFVLDDGFHNGPGCSVCGWNICWHCDTVNDIPNCVILL